MNARFHNLRSLGYEQPEAVLYRSGSVESTERGEQ